MKIRKRFFSSMKLIGISSLSLLIALFLPLSMLNAAGMEGISKGNPQASFQPSVTDVRQTSSNNGARTQLAIDNFAQSGVASFVQSNNVPAQAPNRENVERNQSVPAQKQVSQSRCNAHQQTSSREESRRMQAPESTQTPSQNSAKFQTPNEEQNRGGQSTSNSQSPSQDQATNRQTENGHENRERDLANNENRASGQPSREFRQPEGGNAGQPNAASAQPTGNNSSQPSGSREALVQPSENRTDSSSPANSSNANSNLSSNRHSSSNANSNSSPVSSSSSDSASSNSREASNSNWFDEFQPVNFINLLSNPTDSNSRFYLPNASVASDENRNANRNGSNNGAVVSKGRISRSLLSAPNDNKESRVEASNPSSHSPSNSNNIARNQSNVESVNPFKQGYLMIVFLLNQDFEQLYKSNPWLVKLMR